MSLGSGVVKSLLYISGEKKISGTMKRSYMTSTVKVAAVRAWRPLYLRMRLLSMSILPNCATTSRLHSQYCSLIALATSNDISAGMGSPRSRRSCCVKRVKSLPAMGMLLIDEPMT